MTETQRYMIQREREREKERERKREERERRKEKQREKERNRKKERERDIYHPTVIILRVPNIKIPDFFAQHRPERERHHIQNEHPFILDIMTQNYQEKLSGDITRRYYQEKLSREIITRNYLLVYYYTISE